MSRITSSQRELSIHIIEMVIEETDVEVLAGLSGSVPCLPLGALFLYTNKVLSCLLMTMSGGVALATSPGRTRRYA